MNEQALNYSYELFKKDGYTGTIDQYKQLISSNKEALDYSYSLFKSDGYSGSINDFSSLINPSVGTSFIEQPKKKEATVSPFVDGGSELTKFDPRTGQIIQETPAFAKKEPEADLPKQKLPEMAEFGYQAGKPLPIKKTAPLPKFVEEQISAVTPELIGKTEENVVPQLRYQFGPLGFKFEEVGVGDYMKATSPSGESIEISLDITDINDRRSEANKLNAFLRKGSIAVKNLSTLQKQYVDANKKITSQKELDESLASINQEEANIMAKNADFVKLQTALEAEKTQLESVPAQQRNNPEYIAKVNDFISRANQFSNDFQVFIKDTEDLTKRGQQLNKSIGKYTEMKAEQGTWYGAALNAVLNKSFYNMAKGMAGITIDFLGEVIPATGLPIMSQEDYEKIFIEQAKKEGIDIPEGQDFTSLTSSLDADTIAKIENRVIDAGKKSVKRELIGYIDRASNLAMESSGISPEYYKSIEETFVGGALLGALTSIPAMAGGPVARTVLMSSQVLAGLDDEMANDPAFADVSENEKLLVKAPIAVAVGVLENLGLSNLLKQKGFLNGLVLKALGKVGKGASYKTFGEVIKNEIDSAVGRGALTLGAGFLAEAETGALQEVADITAKEIYNMAKEKEMFDTPDSVVQFIEQVGKASLQEGIGAGVLAVPGSISAAYTGKGFLGMDDNQFMLFEKMANDSNIEKGFVARLKSRINSGEITTAEGKDILNNYRNSVSLFNSLPDNLDIQGKKEAMNLLKERRDLERQIDGKDQALTAPQRNRVNEINQQLTKLSEDAVQKQAAGQVPVQPEARVGQEVAQGEPQAEPQVVTKEGQEEVIPTEEELDLETKLAEDLDVIKSETKPRLRVEGIEIPAEEDIDIETIETNLDRLPAYEVNFVTPTFSQDIQVNPIEESKSQVKEGTAETRPIESFEGVPMVVGMSDILAAGKVTDSMGNPMDVEGGLLYNVLGKNKNAAWAGVTQKGAQTQYNEALQLYKNNKNLFEKLWAEGKLPNGHVPMAIMKMADTAVNSNEAVYRYLNPLVKSQPEANQKAALDALKGDIEVKKKVKQKAIVKSANKLGEFISKNNISSLGQLLDAIIVDANNRAKGDTKNTLSLTERSLLFDLMISPQGIKEASKNTVNALFGSKKDPRAKTFLADTIYNDIAEPSMMKTPKGNIVAVVGIDVLNGGVIPVEHGNYGFGPKGQMIALISNPKHGLDVFPEWKAKATRVFKKSKGGAIPSEQKIADEVGGAFYIDKAFRGAKVSMEPSDIELLSAKLRFAFPDVTISNSKEEFDRVLQEEGVRTKESGGKVILGMTKDGKVYLNPESDSLATPIHEFGHIWIDFLRSKASGKKGDALLSKGLSLVEGTKALQQAIAKYGDNALAREEALVELMATKGETIINKSKQKEFKNWLNALFKYIKEFFITSEQLFKGTDFEQKLKAMSLDDFINIGLADLLKGKEVSSKFKAKETGKGAAELRFRVGDNVQSFINKARAQGYSEAAIKNVLTRSGVDPDAIDAALAKTEPAAKKVEVTEEFAPGYDRVLNEIFGKDGIVDKSRRRGRSEEDTLKNAIDYLQQDTKVYENATDVQREAMVRNLRKEFKKREKTAPSAKKVTGQKKDVVTVTVDLAKERDRIIKEQIKLAKQVTRDLNERRAALANAIRLFEDGGVITTAQAKTIVNRISKVNLNNPIMVDRLLAYIEKVFDNANYAADMAELRKLQRQARSKKHTSMKDFVDRFTYINPELIPLDRIQDYKEALDFLNNLTPSYARMNEMLPEIESYQVSEDFDAAKTIDGLMNKYESIALNQVGSVEEYVNLIKDINSFKRKAFQLLQNQAIDQEEYDNLIEMVGKDQTEIEKRYENQITKIKKDLIAEIKNQRPKINPEFTKEENDLIKEYLELSDSDIESLSPEDLFVLNDLLENVSNGQVDYYRLKDVVSKAANKKAGVAVGKQLKGSKLSLGSAKLREEMAKFESSFWEGLLGLGRATSGPLQKFIISPFNRAIGSFEKFLRDGYNDFLKLKKKYDIKDKQMNNIGMLTTYLQEYMAQFDPKNKDIKDIGKRDWFKEILASETMRDDYSPEELKIIEEIHKSLPKDNDGNVSPEAVYNSYMANDGKFFTKNEKDFFDAIMQWKKENSTSKQKAANEMSGNAFKEIPFHMLRSRYGSMSSQITPTTSGDNGMVRIKAGTGKERASEAVGAINTNFEKLFIKGLEQTGRDYFLSKTLKDINNVLSAAKKELDGDKDPLIKAISYTLSDALAYEFSDTASQNLLKRLVQARASMTLFDPIRAGIEFTSTLLSFGLRARTLSGYKNLFGSQGDMKNLLEFTDSPLRLRQNINNAIDINDGRIEPQGMLMKWTTFLSGLPERTMMVTSWMPTFSNEFQRITGEKFDMKKFNSNESYREKYGKAIKESSAVADAQTEKIIGPTTKAGQRREIVIFPGKTVGRDTVSGQILGFFSNYPYREATEFINGFKEAAEILKKGDSIEAINQLQKPLGIALNVAAYGFLSSVVYASRLILLGDDEEEERGRKLLEELMTAKGFIEEISANGAALAASKYAGGGRAILQVLGTLGIMLTDNEETKSTIKKMMKGSVYVDPLPTQKLSGYGTADKVNTAIIKYIPQFVVLSNAVIDTIGGVNELKAIYDKVERKGVEALTKDEELRVLALSATFTFTQLFLNYKGTSLPSYNNLKAGMKVVKEKAGVSDVAAGDVPSKKSSGGGGSTKKISKSDLKKYFPEQYDEIYGPGTEMYEIEQEMKAFRKEQRDIEKQIKKEIYGGS